MKSVTRAVQDEVWSQSLSRTPTEIYAKDREKRRETRMHWTPDTLKIMAERILERKPVGHNYLWGREAIEMIEKNLIMESDLEPHRSAYAKSLRETYSGDTADIMLLELLTQHEKVKEQNSNKGKAHISNP